jgi:hypothetical protein
MTGLGVALIPSAEIGYNEEIAPYIGQVLLGAHPAGMVPQTGEPSLPQAAAGLARFDSIATAQASASGHRASATDPNHLVAFPTQADVDLIASHLQTQLQQWGAKALYAQAEQGDILGPVITTTETLASPSVGTSLPDGVSHFRVSVALHLRATLIRRAALLQATRQQLLLKVHQARPGFAPVQGQAPKLSILSVAPAGPGEAQLDLLVWVQAQAMIGPALTPEQVRLAVAGKDISEATAYLKHWPGITKVAIKLVAALPNRLPFFSARIYINIVYVRNPVAKARGL